jgi:hypothetical protein
VILPRENATARAVANAVTLAASQGPPEKASEQFPIFLARGIEVATGANRWTGPAETDRPTDGVNNGTDPQAAAAVDSARPAASKRAARLQWD